MLFNYVQSMEIDSRGWMWILDVGRENLFDDPSSLINNLRPKLVVYDIKNRCVIRVHFFPDHVLPGNNSFGNDIVLDETAGLGKLGCGEGDVSGLSPCFFLLVPVLLLTFVFFFFFSKSLHD